MREILAPGMYVFLGCGQRVFLMFPANRDSLFDIAGHGRLHGAGLTSFAGDEGQQ